MQHQWHLNAKLFKLRIQSWAHQFSLNILRNNTSSITILGHFENMKIFMQSACSSPWCFTCGFQA